MINTLLLRRTGFVVFILLCAPAVVLANAGVGFFQPTILHIVLLNPLIGWLEALFLRKAFKLPVRYGIIIAANYASSLVGFLLFLVGDMGFDDGFINVILLFLMLVVSIVVEGPFFLRSLKKPAPEGVKVTWTQIAIVQCLSYMFLLPFYLVTFDSGAMNPAQRLEYELYDLGYDAANYRKDMNYRGGGGGSYKGFFVGPWDREDTLRRSVDAHKDSVVFLVTDADSVRWIARAVVDSGGVVNGPEYWLDAAQDSLKNVVRSRLTYLAGEAYKYRLRPFYRKGMGGTYQGYMMEEHTRQNMSGRYTAVVTPDSVVFEGVSPDTTVPVMRVVADSAGMVRLVN